MPAVAIAGMSISNESTDIRLKKHDRLFIALDNTDDANTQSHTIAKSLGAKAYLASISNRWCKGCKRMVSTASMQLLMMLVIMLNKAEKLVAV